MWHTKSNLFVTLGIDFAEKAVEREFTTKWKPIFKLMEQCPGWKVPAQVDEAFVELDVSEYWPNIAAFGQYAYNGSSDDWKFNTYSSATIGLGISINLWQGNRTKNAVEQSTITYQQTEEQVKQLKDYTLLNVKSKIQDLKTVQSIIDVQNKNVEVAERAYQIAKVRYKEGVGSQMELQNTDLSLKQARLNRIQSMHLYLITKFELEQVLGKTNPEYFSSFSELED